MNVALLLANWIKVLKQTQLGHEIVAKKYMKLPVWSLELVAKLDRCI